MRGFDDETKGIASSSTGKVKECAVHFTQKNRFSTKNNPMCGITFWKWLLLLRKSYRNIEWQYLPRAIFITILSIVNSLLCMIEHFLYWNRIRKVKLPDDPVFIIGHPRTGTTVLHNILSADEENFFFCSTFCAGFPSSFLFFEKYGKYLFSGVIEKTRPMDSMPLHFDLPQEDECGTNVLSGGLSYYMPLWFMKQENEYRKYLDFDPRDGGRKEDESEWCESFIYLMKKLCLRQQIKETKNQSQSQKQKQDQNQSGKQSPNNAIKSACRLLLKSPIHTARVPLLLKLFPKAKFIYIHRHPDEIFVSAVHLADTAYWYCSLNTASDTQILEYILWQFEQLWLKYDKAVNNNLWNEKNENSIKKSELVKISPPKKLKNRISQWDTIKLENINDRQILKNVLEISYDDLCTDTTISVMKIYRFLELTLTTEQLEILQKEEINMKTYAKNVYVPLRNDLKILIRNRWAAYFSAFGYK